MAPLLLLLLLLPVLLLLASADEYPASCIKASCAGVDVHYPFWLNSFGSDNCGYPSLGLACEMSNASLILAVHSHSYRVINIDYTKHTIVVSDTDAKLNEYEGDCPRLHANLTIDYTSSWLQPTLSDSHITFLYNCTKNMSWTSAVELLGCREEYGNRRRRSYVLPDGVTTGIEAYDYCWNRPSALLPINHRLFCRSTVGSFADQPSKTNTDDEPWNGEKETMLLWRVKQCDVFSFSLQNI
jgi:hypothetical protein